MPFIHLTVPSATALLTAAFTGVWDILGFALFLITVLLSSTKDPVPSTAESENMFNHFGLYSSGGHSSPLKHEADTKQNSEKRSDIPD